ncbi:ATP-dependent DNA helicase [Lachnospiraceae bacterium OttesenSCG-928-D06]|nr:ATP-dependent DNA helicase [Lachnospiraceae bacterium OttesenSCG-928-D06]
MGNNTGMEIKISVRRLVEFILRHGDIDSRRQGAAPENAMQEGSRIHRMIQRKMGADYQAEVFLRYMKESEKYTLIVEGRADGIIDNGDITIDEIKGTYRDLARMREPSPIHLAQAKCYAYIYGSKREAEEVNIRMTYCNIETEELRYFYENCTMKELTLWFESLIASYQKWADYEWEWKKKRRESAETLSFPFPYRDGQKELVSYVYQTIYHKRKLFMEAPTGVGKTISTIFPSVKAMGQGRGERIFYLTAKTITRTVADNTFKLLRENGLFFKSVILTAKDKICFMEETKCNPQYCPYAKGHYDRINDAVYDLLTHEDSFSREMVERYGRKHMVCPFELGLDMSLFADGIIGDYNYLFDPHVYLKRFFSEGAKGDYIFLIDEAHNLLERGREMYSAKLVKESFLELKKSIRKAIKAEEMGGSALVSLGYGRRLIHQLERSNKELLTLKRDCEEECQVVSSIEDLVNTLLRLQSTIDTYLGEPEEGEPEIREEILEFYFVLCHFMAIYERIDENYIIYSRIMEDGSFLLKLFNVNPSSNLRECMERGVSSILFSATFLPIQYYKGLLGGGEEDYEVYADSVFNQEKRALLIANDVTSKYSRRSSEEFFRIAEYIYEVVKNRHGNYMVFAPSYGFMHTILDIYQAHFHQEGTEYIVQQESMNEEERESFLGRFEKEIDPENETILIGFCVLGGIFSEGIDLKGDQLIGAVIIGTGLPQIGQERELLKRYFDQKGENGFDYSYRYPGMNKVLQAAGRVIRTGEDIGVIALLDERFLQYSTRRIFPREWEQYDVVNKENIGKKVERFWDSWL